MPHVEKRVPISNRRQHKSHLDAGLTVFMALTAAGSREERRVRPRVVVLSNRETMAVLWGALESSGMD